MDYYDRIAEGYNELHGEEQRKKLDIIKKHFQPKGKILDIGAGTGISEEYFENITLLDPSKELLKKAKGKTVVGKAEELPFEDKSFDAIISITALHHADIDKAIEEIKRVSKENCTYAFSILKKSKDHDMIVKKLKENFKLTKKINEEKDTILIS